MVNTADRVNANENEDSPPDSGRSAGSEVGVDVDGGGVLASSSESPPGSGVAVNVAVGGGSGVAVKVAVGGGSGVAVGVCFGVGVGCWAREIVPLASANSPLSSNNVVKTNDP